MDRSRTQGSPQAAELISRPDADVVDFGREVCGDLDAASREWLLTNGAGAFASGTISGALSRRYHGLLVAALAPPLGRTLLVSKADEVATYRGTTFELGCNVWSSGAVSPSGHRHLERFRLDGTTPVFTYALHDALLEKRILMRRGENSTYVVYRLVRGDEALRLVVKFLVNHRDHHGATRGDFAMRIEPQGDSGLRITARANTRPFYLLSSGAAARPRHEWYRGYSLSVEKERGFDGEEDHLFAGEFTATLAPGGSVTFVATTESAADLDGESRILERAREERALLARAHAASEPAAVRQLILAADQFIVERPSPRSAASSGVTVIAGYPWFSDWGRDTMLSLSGLTLVTGRPELARGILLTFAGFLSRGMLPNRFPDAANRDEPPEYNTADATLWYFEALRAYFAATGDLALVRELYSKLVEILDWHDRGTRHGIAVDPRDGLLMAGEAGVQLTWMDAKVGDWVVTPRRGKPVEINALFYNALRTLADFAQRLESSADAERFAKRADNVQAAFSRFINPRTGCLFDVLDGPEGDDAALRPNQILAVSLSHSPLSPDVMKSVVDACALHLLTSFGLRSLGPKEAGYRGQCTGDVRARDGAYHQGTVWSWLIGPFAVAHHRVYGDAARARSYLQPLLNHLRTAGLGTLSEIFDGDPPHLPRGCIAQAWSVAEWLRAYYTLPR